MQTLLRLPSSAIIPYFEPKYIKEVMGQLVKKVIEEQNWQPILDIQREMPCEEDFEPWDTNVRKDFLRKWYHTRSKRLQTASLEAYMEDEDSGIHEVEDVSAEFEDGIIAEDFCERFRRCSPKGIWRFWSFEQRGLPMRR